MTNSRYAADIVAHSRGRAYAVHTQPQCESLGYVWDAVNNCCVGHTCPEPTPTPTPTPYPTPPQYPPVSRCKREFGGSCNNECSGWGGYRCEQCVKECGPPNCGRGKEWDHRHKKCRECSPWEDWYGGKCRHKYPGKPRPPSYWPPHIVNVEPPDVTVNIEDKAETEAAGGPPAFLTGECMPGIPVPCGLLALGAVGAIAMVAMVAIGRK